MMIDQSSKKISHFMTTRSNRTCLKRGIESHNLKMCINTGIACYPRTHKLDTDSRKGSLGNFKLIAVQPHSSR